ncbi:ABC transporter permease subunit [uncultured Tessaracoccus sp.]|uniref:ABC transporter permease subunit n=1 Tax=uncultured Tessaracoccus sp. TaxID=905023 RepID=UPI0025D5D468|nr:hypothetical protein [uncultured Tessaracoccus sp.]
MTALALTRHQLARHWRGATIVVATVIAMLLLGFALYRRLDLAVYEALPEAVRSLLGVPAGAGAEVLATNEMLAVMGALALAGVAVAVGAQLVAGEERAGRLSLVLAQPVGRRTLVVASAASLTTVVGLAGAGLWAATWLAAALVGADVGEAHLAALCVAVAANALFHGAIAFALGAATGSPGLAGGIAGTVAAVGWVLAGVLPLEPDLAHATDLVPWAWYSEPQVLVDGLDGGRLALLLGGAALAFAVATQVFPRRDLRTAAPLPCTARLAALRRRFGPRGAARGSSPLALALGRGARLTAVVSLVMALMAFAMGPLYASLREQMAPLLASFPQELLTLFGAGDMRTPTGFLWGEVLGFMAPVAVIVAGASAACGLAAEERSGRLGLLLAQPVSRAHVLAATVGALALHTLAVALATGVGLQAGQALGGLGVPGAHVVGACLHLWALGLAVGGAAVLVAAATGRADLAAWAAVGIGTVGHFGYAALQLSPDTAGWGKLSPFHWYASAMPLDHGAVGGDVAVLTAAGVLACLVAGAAFQRRDLRA